MYRYILKRLLMAIPVLIGATFLVFTIMHFAPGDPAKIILGSSATEAALELKREELGLNDPFFVQFGNFMLGLLQGDMGTSYRTGCYKHDSSTILEHIDTGIFRNDFCCYYRYSCRHHLCC